MVGLTIEVHIDPAKRFEFLQTFELMTQKAETEKGWCSKTIYEKVGAPNCFLWMNCWETEASLSAYLDSDRFKSLLGAAQVLGSRVQIQKITFKDTD
jgi:quinol monooxygenase YgiN